ncbi:GGDEF domain-containing protein [Campylobacter concisus]
MIKIDNAPDPKKKAIEVKHILEKEKVDIYRFSENVLHELSDDNVPSTPNNYSIYFEKMLDGQPDEFRKEIGDMIVINSEISVPSGSNISIEKEIKQGFIQIKSMLQAVVLIYKNLGIMRGLVQKRMDALKNNTNILALQNVLSAFNHDLIKLNSLMDKHLDVIKVSYDEVAKMLKSIEEQSIYDTTYDVYNKKFLVATVQSEVEAVKRYGYNASFLLVRAKDRFTNRVKNLKERNNMYKAISQLLLRTSRRSDIVAHYGDGCFAMVMKYTDENGTKQAGSRILNMLSSIPWKIDGEECKLDIQVVSSMITKTRSAEELISYSLDQLILTQDDEQPIFLGE